MRARLALLAAATCLAGAANAATIYPLDRATVLSASPFDFKVELDAVYEAGDIDVTVNGKPYAEIFGQEAEFVTDEKGKNDESLGSALILREAVSGSRWLAAGLGLVGAFIAASPGNVPWTPALLAALAAVLAGTGAIIVTRQLKGTPPVVMMLFYTGGLALITAWPALSGWQPVAAGHWPFLLAVGVFSQAAQFCFLRAHWLGDAGFLGPLGYSSLILSGLVGYVFFGEIPSLNTVIGAVIIVLATGFLTLRTARLRSHAASGN